MTNIASRRASAAAPEDPAHGSAAAQAGAAPAAGGRPTTAGRGGALRESLARTPGKLRLLAVVAVIACLAFGILGFQVAQLQAAALDRAQADTTQLSGVQDTRNALVSADATAANAFLVGGLEPSSLRTSYENSIADAAESIARLSGADNADAERLGDVNQDLTTYTGLIEQARANNRQGFPVGSGYLDAASNQLRAKMLPDLDKVTDHAADRAAGDFNTISGVLWLLALGLLVLVILVLGQVWLARRTHRVFNKGLVAATALVLIVGLGATFFQTKVSSDANAVRNGSYAASLAMSQAYSEANDAKSMESFTLIKRGSGQAYEKQFQQSTADAADRLADAYGSDVLASNEAGKLLAAWIDQHKDIRKLDDEGSWDKAVEAATATGPGTANAAFDSFADEARKSMEQSAQTTRSDLSAARTTALVAGWIVLAAGVAAAALAWRGVSVRLKEYR